MKRRFINTIILAAAGLLMLPATASAATVKQVVIDEHFASYAASACPQYTDGDTIGPWKVVFTGYGCVRVVDNGAGKVLEMQPKAPVPAATSAETHSTLLTSSAPIDGDFIYEGTVSTTKQLRTQPAPNTWETAWVVWNYTDNDHFYYMILKENGWEIGKRDPAYPGGQRFLATGTQPRFPLTGIKQFMITKTDTSTAVSVNGATLTTFVDNERPYTTGAVGMYTEDAAIRVNALKVTALRQAPAAQPSPVAPSAPQPATPATQAKPASSAAPAQAAATSQTETLAATGESSALVVALSLGSVIGGLVLTRVRP